MTVILAWLQTTAGVGVAMATYNDKMRRELLNGELIDSVLEGQLLLDDWREDFQHLRPHQSLGYLTPVEFARRWRWKMKVESHNGWTDERGPVTCTQWVAHICPRDERD